MLLGIEIGGTKLQLGVGRGDGSSLLELIRLDVDPAKGADGILRQIHQAADGLLGRHTISALGIGFGGPVDCQAGRVVKSHHVDGWADFPLADWCRRAWNLPVQLANDADLAGLAEARFGAARDANPVLYVTVGTGIGGGLIIDGKVYRGHSAGAAEIGHLRPGLQADTPDATVEAIASGWGIAAAAQAYLSGPVTHRLVPLRANSRHLSREDVRQHLIAAEEAAEEHTADLWRRCDGDPEHLTAKLVAQAAAEANDLAQDILSRATQALGWAIAQVITLVSPQVVVVGGGVALAGEELFFRPLRSAVERYVFPPFAGSYRIEPAQLGEEVVVHGALALARTDTDPRAASR